MKKFLGRFFRLGNTKELILSMVIIIASSFVFYIVLRVVLGVFVNLMK